MRLSRLRGRKICANILRKGHVWKGKTFLVRWLPGHPRNAKHTSHSALYIGTLASSKLHKSAVKRNRMRRRCREALRTIVREMQVVPTTQLLILPRLCSLETPFSEIQDEVRSFLRSLPMSLH